MEYNYRADFKGEDGKIISAYFSSEIDEITEELLHSIEKEKKLGKLIKIIQE